MNVGAPIAAYSKTLLTLYFKQDEAEAVVKKLNAMHRRFRFECEKVDDVYMVYCISDKDSELVRKELLVFLLDRMAYGINNF